MSSSLLRSQPGEPVTDKIRRAAFWILMLIVLGVIASVVSTASGRADVPKVNGISVTAR